MLKLEEMRINIAPARRRWLWFVVVLGVSAASALWLWRSTPSTQYSGAVAQFLTAAVGVNATFLVTVSVAFGTLYRDIPDPEKGRWLLVFLIDLIVLFLGMIAAAVGMVDFIQLVPVSSPWVFAFLLFVVELFAFWRWKEQPKQKPA